MILSWHGLSAMRLEELNPSFIQIVNAELVTEVKSIEEAQGLRFSCPFCYEVHGGLQGSHPIILWFFGRGVPSDMPPSGRWRIVQGETFADLKLLPSIRIVDRCGWVGLVGVPNPGDVSSLPNE